MYIQPDGKKRNIVLESDYFDAEMVYDCDTETLKVVKSSCGNSEPVTVKKKTHSKPMPKRTLADVAKGVAGIAKSELGINKVSQGELDARWSACQACDQNQYGFCGAKKKKTGRACGCRVCDMIRDSRATCPIDAWG